MPQQYQVIAANAGRRRPQSPEPASPRETPVSALFVADAAAAKVVGVSKNHFRNLVRQRLLPQPKRLGKRCVWDLQALVDAVRAA